MTTQVVEPLSLTVPLALQLGWSMAVLYGPLGAPAKPEGAPAILNIDHLPTEHELNEEQRIDFELHHLDCLLISLNAQQVAASTDQSATMLSLNNAWQGKALADGEEAPELADRRNALRKELRTANVTFLEGLACSGPEVELAYQVGRTLRDTSNLPLLENHGPRNADELTEGLLVQLSGRRIATLQQWLATLAPQFPAHAAAVVSASVGRWSDLAGVALDGNRPGKLSKGTDGSFAKAMAEFLLPQGDVWLQLLAGTRSADGLLSPEGYVAAGESSLRRSTKIVMKVLRHYWVALVVLAAALGAILLLSGLYLGGAGKVWTQIAAIATSLGVTAKGIGSTTSRLAKEAEAPIFGLEKEDAMAWAVTALPPAQLSPRGVLIMRKAGVAPSGPLGRI